MVQYQFKTYQKSVGAKVNGPRWAERNLSNSRGIVQFCNPPNTHVFLFGPSQTLASKEATVQENKKTIIYLYPTTINKHENIKMVSGCRLILVSNKGDLPENRLPQSQNSSALNDIWVWLKIMLPMTHRNDHV